MAEKFPEDEFDHLPDSPRAGAHRASERGRRGLWFVLIAVIAVVVVAGLAYVGLRFLGSGTPAADEGQRSSASTPPPAVSDTPATSSTPSASPTAPEASPSPSSTPSPSASPSVDPRRTTQVSVLNGTQRTGLAARAAETLQSDGWTVATTGNAPSSVSGQTNSVVYYEDASAQAAAQEVARVFGIGTVRQGNVGSTPVTVVLGSSFSAQ